MSYIKESVIRLWINRSEYLMLKQLIDKCRPYSDLGDFNGEREALHTFAVKLMNRQAIVFILKRGEHL